ncbi:MAG TPA: holo-ACP synthase [Gemmatimonadaceae bacterium]|nr:holo-ACP synthase [Gemmatimonadaceae bacterium]
MIVGVGIDLVEIARVRRLVEGKGERALQRLFTDGELAYANRRTDPMPHLAARVAAKEATFKAFGQHDGSRSIGWKEMEVVSGDDGNPTLRLHGAAARLAGELGITRLWVSLSHTQGAAGAVVIIER